MFQTIFGLSDKTYNALKWLVTIVLPAFGAFYFGLAPIWGLPNAEQVVGTVTLVVTFGGVLLGLSTKAYNNAQTIDGTGTDVTDGEIMVDSSNPAEGSFVALDSSVLAEKDTITLKVKDISSSQ